jgi:hypothetical protein
MRNETAKATYVFRSLELQRPAVTNRIPVVNHGRAHLSLPPKKAWLSCGANARNSAKSYLNTVSTTKREGGGLRGVQQGGRCSGDTPLEQVADKGGSNHARWLREAEGEGHIGGLLPN